MNYTVNSDPFIEKMLQLAVELGNFLLIYVKEEQKLVALYKPFPFPPAKKSLAGVALNFKPSEQISSNSQEKNMHIFYGT